MTTLIIMLVLFGLLCISMPVSFSMAVSGVVGLFMFGGVDMAMSVLTRTMLSAVDKYELITIPMFLLMAEFVIVSGIADSLFRAAAAWIGRVPGGLGMATALSGAGFGAVCGTSSASAATLSSTSLPAMIRQGYEPSMAAGVVAVSGTLAMLIPPSVAFVVFGLLAEVSIGKLLIAGILPAVVVTITIMSTVAFLVWRDPSRAPLAPHVPMSERWALTKEVAPMVILFAVITGLIYSGISTPTEAAALGALTAFLLAAWRRKINRKTTLHALRRAAIGTSMILIILLGASMFSYAFVLTRVTQDLVMFVGDLDVSRWVIIVIILCIYLILGCFMDQMAILVLTVPVVLPVVVSLGFDPIWYGVLLVVTAEVGLITPPVGINCFIVARYSGRPIGEVFRGAFPHVIAHIIALAILTAFPIISLYLPSKM
ncbi:MAG TPA: TRAP transporter large permease [Rhizobiaceae bacterium]|nr:TRAP transporter large permease [Rhizobiaceae bacterium]